MSEIERVSLALNILARVIERDGPKYLPLYERLEQEMLALEARSDALARALARAERIRDNAG